MRPDGVKALAVARPATATILNFILEEDVLKKDGDKKL
jgi:hypothetical protein